MKNLSNFTKMSDDPISNVYIISIVDPLCAPYWWFFLDGQVRKLLSFVEHSLSFCKSRGYIFKIIFFFRIIIITCNQCLFFFTISGQILKDGLETKHTNPFKVIPIESLFYAVQSLFHFSVLD